jgi:predicted ATPase
MSATASPPESLLRTLAPALVRIEQRLRAWLPLYRRKPLQPEVQAQLQEFAFELERHAKLLEADRPFLVIVLMGGTGVGKSSLLNALARGKVAVSSFTRPTTRDPVVYYHISLPLERLDQALRDCRMVAHDRTALADKVLVDTPDLDSNILEHREKLQQILPLADVVLYVGSQEKYHDEIGWDLFLEQRQRRAFAFVLNKWDRCLHGFTSGSRPDEDLIRSLKTQGFEQPLIFRTCAHAWIDSEGERPALPPGEEFPSLEKWLEQGLTVMEVEAIKARGIGQMLVQLRQALEEVRPPEVASTVRQVINQWRATLDEEASEMAHALISTLDPSHREIERHFAVEGQRRFRGLMAAFLRMATHVRYWGISLRKHMPKPLSGNLAEAAETTTWDLASFSRTCADMATDRHLDVRLRALPNRLLAEADAAGLPVPLLADDIGRAMPQEMAPTISKYLIETLQEEEKEWTQPAGSRRLLNRVFVWLGDLLPLLVLLVSSGFLLYDYFFAVPRRAFTWTDLLLPVISVFFTLLILYIVMIFLLPIRWPAIKHTFRSRLTERLRQELHAAYLHLPEKLEQDLTKERQEVDKVLSSVRDLELWLQGREETSRVTALYGKE